MSSSKVKKTIRTKPELWKCLVDTIKDTNHYGIKGKWNARRSQLAVRLYKQMGGGYIGKKNPKNLLTKWTKEDWNYINKDKKGRYLPKKVRDSLSDKEKKKENKLKRGNKGKRVPYGSKVQSLMKSKKIY